MAVLNVRDLLIDRVGVPVTSRQRISTVQQNPLFAEVLRGDPSRIGFELINASAFVILVSFRPNPGTGRAFRLEPNGGALLANWEEDGERVAWAWFGTCIGSTAEITAFEQLIDAKAQRSGPREG